MPSFEIFCDRLNREKAKLSQLDSLTGSQSHALVARPSSGTKEKTQKSHSTEFQIDFSTYGSSGSPPPKGGKSKLERLKCAYCNKPNHDESHCYEKKLDGYAK